MGRDIVGLEWVRLTIGEAVAAEFGAHQVIDSYGLRSRSLVWVLDAAFAIPRVRPSREISIHSIVSIVPIAERTNRGVNVAVPTGTRLRDHF